MSSSLTASVLAGCSLGVQIPAGASETAKLSASRMAGCYAPSSGQTGHGISTVVAV